MKKDFKIVLIVLALVVVLTAGCIANFFSSSLFIGAASFNGGGVYAMAEECFLVYLNKSQNSHEAEVIAGDFVDAGNAGYIFKHGDYYYAVHSAYANKNDATLFAEHLKKGGIQSEILQLSFPKIFIEEDLSAENRNLLSEALNSFFAAFKALSDISVGFSTNAYSLDDVNQKLQKLCDRTASLQKKYAETFKNTSAKLTALGEYLADELECLMLTKTSESDLNYHGIELIEIYQNMIQELK